ncbi:SusD/RagB family nutrient-binding outer membrane lipoprotein [Tunicatimonas pelagia]|uniref:SusD/RagB family nutrient-binding outer membrane lipoprotein n=1 Tax=Tunicatimonas pelagia TaxID=931531 RepID=UPI002666CB68|nr:SusD/RagB family nutrient-binding outer membrane lipoprotein [Tunicatimonas pelagia]WKN44182.1 SusD/RagB family nutrient-binding outer membrane lipoprotein [Tunicatimonas pelagia]
MKKILSVTVLIISVLFSCTESDFEDAYADPGKLASTSIDRQFTGFLYQNREYVLKAYINYFVVLRTSLNRYMQIIGWENEPNQYIPPSSGSDAVWNNYYGTLFQFRELEKTYNNAPETEQADKKIFMLAAKVYMYDYTQRVTDLYGAIPFLEAGRLSQNGGDYVASLAEFDDPSAIYTFMLDELATIADDLNDIALTDVVQSSFTIQDYVNEGDVDSWRRYCNSLRLRMLTRVQDAPEFSARATTEIGQIVSNAADYPVVEDNDQNIQIDVVDFGTPVNSNITTLENDAEGWYSSFAGQAFLDQMVSTGDPRLPYIWEPGENAEGVYNGIDQLADAADVANDVGDGLIAQFNRGTYARNRFFPGLIINAAEVDLYKAEYYLKSGDDAMGKASYESSVAHSVDHYVRIRAVTNDVGPAPEPITPTEEDVSAYLAGADVSWDAATTNDEKLELIARQKWVHYNIIQPYENWAEFRRLDQIDLVFEPDNSNIQTLPPVRFNIPGSEQTFNEVNYARIAADDDLNNSLFWDLN